MAPGEGGGHTGSEVVTVDEQTSAFHGVGISFLGSLFGVKVTYGV